MFSYTVCWLFVMSVKRFFVVVGGPTERKDYRRNHQRGTERRDKLFLVDRVDFLCFCTQLKKNTRFEYFLGAGSFRRPYVKVNVTFDRFWGSCN